MNQQFSVLGLFFSILILAKNSTSVLNNVLQNKPMNIEDNHSTLMMKTTFLNKKFINFNRTNNLNVHNSTRLNNIIPVTSLVTSSQNNRFPRQVPNKYYNEDTEYNRYIKVILDLKPDNYEDMYDYYDSGKYNDNRKKKVNGLIDDSNLHREIEQNSRPITRNLNESQERKRCTKKITQNVGSINHQQPQKLLPTINIEDGIVQTLKCKDCEVLKSNINSGEPKNNYNNNLQSEQMDDEYFIKILNQLIDKINKPKNSKSTSIKDLPIQKSFKPTMIENRFFENPNTNSSSSEEVIVKLEKIKGNRILNKLESSPENTFVNGNWIRNKITENEVKDRKPIENDSRSGFNDKNESISKNDIKQLNLNDSKNHVIETDDHISNKLKDLSVVTVQENKYISTTSPLPEENEHLSLSKETITPYVVSSTSKDKSDSRIIDDNYKLTTEEHTDQYNKEDNISSYDENNKSQDKQFQPSINNFPTTATIFESTKELTSDLNETLKIQNPDGIAESNDNNPNTNYSKVDTIAVDEKQNSSLDDNVNCNCNKKIIKNILSSSIVTNITEIKTDIDTSSNSLKMNSHKRSNQLLKKNGEINKSNNNNNEDHLIKNKEDFNSGFLVKEQATFESKSKNNLKESNLNLLIGSTNINRITDNSQSQGTTDSKTNKNNDLPESQLKGQRKRNNDDNNNKVKEIDNKRMSLINKLPQINKRQYVMKLKRLPQNDDIAVRNNDRENNNMDKIIKNNNIFSKSSTQTPNKIVSRTQLKTTPEISSKKIENIIKQRPGHLIEKMKLDKPINSKIHTSEFGEYDNTNYLTTKKILASPRILSRVPIKNNNKHSPQTTPINLEERMDNYYDDNDSKNFPRKLITESDKYTSFYPNTRIVKNLKENINKENIIPQKYSISTYNLDPVQLQRPSTLGKSIESTKIQMMPKKKIVNIYSTKSPIYGKNNNTVINFSKTKLSKPALLIRNPKTISSSDTTKQIKNDENMSILKLNNAITKVPLFSDKIAKTKHNIFDKPLTLTLKNKNILSDQSPTERIFIQKTDSKQNVRSEHDADSNVLLKSYPPEKSQLEEINLGDDDHDEHAPYTNDYLEPILFHGPTEKAKISNKNTQYISSPISRQPSNRNQKHNKLDEQLSEPVPISRSEQDENYDDTPKNNKVEVNFKKQKIQPGLNTSNNVPTNNDTSDDYKYEALNPNDESPKPNRFGVLSQVKIADGVFKIPLVSQTSVDNNGSEYVSEMFIPIEKSDGRHSAIPLTKLLTGDFKLLNEPGVENLSVIQPTPEIDSTLGSTHISTDCEHSDITDYSVNTNPSKILEAIKDHKNLSAPVHIIQIINNGQCSYKHNNSTDTIKKSVHEDNEHTFQKIRNEGKRLSSIKSKNTPYNNRQIDRKIGDAYKHFDSGILDRFLQVYSPHLV